MLNLQYHYDWLKRDWFMNMTVYGLVQKLVALLGFLCIFFNILLPVLAFFMRLLFVDVPHEWRVLLLRRAQQHELQRLQRRVDVLTRRKEAVSTKQIVVNDMSSMIELISNVFRRSRKLGNLEGLQVLTDACEY